MSAQTTPRANYRGDEVKTLVEEYEELRELKGTEQWRLRYLVTLADLDRSLRRMPPKEYQAVLLCGLLSIATRTAGALLGVSGETMRKRYLRGLEWLLNDLNGG
jgi:DNA-directed RNA polymerase specialized sigma24 family protein